MWSESDIQTRDRIIDSAYDDLERKIKKWWKDQEYKKNKCKNHKIEPFIIWIKRNNY